MTGLFNTAETEESGRSRAVSPVIGVVLMVAITIILAAVIGAFVLGFGADTEGAPSASFTSDQDEDPFEVDSDPAEVTFTHNGGDNIDADNVEVRLPDSGDALDDANDPVTGLDDGELSAGDTVVVDFDDDADGVDIGDDDVDDGDRVVLAFESGDQSQILATHTLNIDEE